VARSGWGHHDRRGVRATAEPIPLFVNGNSAGVLAIGHERDIPSTPPNKDCCKFHRNGHALPVPDAPKHRQAAFILNPEPVQHPPWLTLIGGLPRMSIGDGQESWWNHLVLTRSPPQLSAATESEERTPRTPTHKPLFKVEHSNISTRTILTRSRIHWLRSCPFPVRSSFVSSGNHKFRKPEAGGPRQA